MISKVNELLSIGYGKLFSHLKPVAKSSFHTKITEFLQTNDTVVKLNEGKAPAAGNPFLVERMQKSEPLKWPTADEIGHPIGNDRLEGSLPGTSNSGIQRNLDDGGGETESEVTQIRQTSKSSPITIEDIRNSKPLRWPTAEEIKARINYNRFEE